MPLLRGLNKLLRSNEASRLGIFGIPIIGYDIKDGSSRHDRETVVLLRIALNEGRLTI